MKKIIIQLFTYSSNLNFFLLIVIKNQKLINSIDKNLYLYKNYYL